MNNQSATERILQVVSSVKSEARRAESEFDRRNSDIQRKASRSIDLFGGSATSQVADIARDARRACDDLYSAYQSLVRIVDEQCRPLLDQDPAVTAVKEVCDLIKWLNDESEIENNFTASLNSRGLGDVASARYIPTMDNKMIQRYWENKYAMWPGRAEQEAQARREAEERRRAQQEAAKKAHEEEIRKFAEKMDAYQREHKEWQRNKDSIAQTRARLLQTEVDRERSRLQQEVNAAYEKTRDNLRKEKEDCAAWKAAAEAKLPSLGFFAFGEKSETKKTIQAMTARIAQLDAKLAENESWYQNEKRDNDRKLREAQKKIEARLEKEHPFPTEPRKPVGPQVLREPPTPQMIANYGVMEAILDSMEPAKLYTIPEIMDNCPACADLTNQRVSALVRQLVSSGNVERLEERRMAYFRVVRREFARPVYIPSGAAAVSADAGGRPTAQQVADQAIRQAILEFMEPGRLYTITEVLHGCPACADMTNQRCSAYIRQLVSSGDIERIEERMKAYFRRV